MGTQLPPIHLKLLQLFFSGGVFHINVWPITPNCEVKNYSGLPILQLNDSCPLFRSVFVKEDAKGVLTLRTYLSLTGHLRLVRMLLEPSLQVFPAVLRQLCELPSPSWRQYIRVFRL